MATNTIQRITVDLAASVQVFAEAAGQTFRKGDLCKIVAGSITIANTPATDINLVVATQDATGVTGNKVLAARVDEKSQLEMTLFHATPASAVIAQADVGTAYGWVSTALQGTTCFTVNKADVTNLRLKVTEILLFPIAEKGALIDFYPRVKCTPFQSLGASQNWF
jgi:hypothetical protein